MLVLLAVKVLEIYFSLLWDAVCSRASSLLLRLWCLMW